MNVLPTTLTEDSLCFSSSFIIETSVQFHSVLGSDPFIMVNTACNTQPPHVRMGALAWKRCVGCGCKILDRFLLFALDGYWHCHCLKCSCCQAQLAEIGSSCFTKRGLILCKSDYIRSDYRNNTLFCYLHP